MIINEFVNSIPQIADTSKFWLVRTMSGDFFHDYLVNEFIAFGYNEITYYEVKKSFDAFPSEDPKDREQRIRSLGEIIKTNSNLEHHNYWASQIMRFCFEIKEGDYVLIPSYSSDDIAVGIVLDSNVFIQTTQNAVDTPCTFNKRKKVKWIATANRGKIVPELYPLFSSRHAVSEANFYSNFILNTAYGTYKRFDELHTIFHVRTKERISMWDYGFFFDIASLTSDYYEDKGIEEDIHAIDLKSSVNSPGIFEFISQNINLLWIFSVIIILVTGGDIDVLGVKIKTPGTLKAVADFLHKRQHTKMIRDARLKMKKMELKGPKEIEELINKYLKNDSNDKEE